MTTKEQDDDRAALLEAIYKALPDMDDNLAQAVRAYGDARANQAHREGMEEAAKVADRLQEEAHASHVAVEMARRVPDDAGHHSWLKGRCQAMSDAAEQIRLLLPSEPSSGPVPGSCPDCGAKPGEECIHA